MSESREGWARTAPADDRSFEPGDPAPDRDERLDRRQPYRPAPDRGLRVPWPLWLLMGALSVVLLAAIAVLTTTWWGDEPAALPEQTSQTLTPVASPETAQEEPSDSAAAPSPTNGAATSQSPQPDPAQGAEEPSLVAEMAEGRVTLTGEVPTADDVTSLISLVESVVGAGNVTNTLVINESVPPPDRLSLIVTDAIVFAPGSAEIATEFLTTLDQIIEFMNLDPNLTLVVEGHTDSQGDAIKNLALSQQRAEAVVDYAAANGINRFRLEPRGRGSTEPIADESTLEGRQRNRRIEFDIGGLRLAPDS